MEKKEKSRTFGASRCENCGKEFEKRTTWQKFCLPKCHDDYHRKGKESFRGLAERVDKMEREILLLRKWVGDLERFLTKEK